MWYIHKCTYIHTCIHMYTYTHIQINKYVHTYIYTYERFTPTNSRTYTSPGGVRASQNQQSQSHTIAHSDREWKGYKSDPRSSDGCWAV